MNGCDTDRPLSKHAANLKSPHVNNFISAAVAAYAVFNSKSLL
jgi:hypothetical protein